MQLKYVIRSRFLVPIHRALDDHGSLESEIRIDLGPRGYERDVEITIPATGRTTFTSNWSGSDPSRFSARIRAAATALRDRGLSGRYHVTHFSGILTIKAK